MPSWAPLSCAPTSNYAGTARRPRRLYRHWLKVLKDDKRAIFTAAAHAQRAADYLNQKAAAQVPETCAA